MIPLVSFLHRIFPYGAYGDSIDLIVNRKLFKPRNDCEPFFLEFPIDWEANDRLEDRNWRMQLQGWTYFHAIMNIFDEYVEKEKLIHIFLEFSRNWFSVYGEDAEDIKTTRMPESYAWYDMSVGFRALVIAFFLDRIASYKLPVAEKDMAFIRDIGLKHVRHLSHEKVFSLNNHGIFQIQGLMALCQLLEGVEKKEEVLAYGIQKMEELVKSQFGADGIHLEHSPHYHFYVCATFEAVTQTGWYKGSDIISERISKALERKRWLVDPLTRPVCVGDSILTPQTTVNFLLKPEDRENSDLLISDFHTSGYAVVRSPWNATPEIASMLFLTAAYHSKSHKHRDCLSFDWFDRGERIICDGGKYGYRSDKYRNYFLSARAHNSVEIENFDIIKIKPYGSAIRDIRKVDANIYCISAALEYPAINHARQVYLCPGRWVAVFDNLAFQRAKKFTQWFHLSPGFDVKSISGTKIIAADKTRSLIVQCMDEGLQVSAYHGDEDGLNGWVSEKDYKFEPAWAIGFSGFDKQHSVITTFALGEEEHTEVQQFVANGFTFSSGQNESELAEMRVEGGVGVLSTESATIPASADISVATRMLKAVPHYIFDVTNEPLRLRSGAATYTVEMNGLKFHFFANILDNKALTVLLPGAINRAKGLVDFQRHSWAKELGTSVISFSDPTINADNDISIGWFQGTEKAFGVDLLERIITSILLDNSISQSNVTILGSSAGGFVGLKLANRLPEARIIAINPQIFLYSYVQSHYERMMRTCYPGLSIQEAAKVYLNRITVEAPSENRNAPIYIIQNTMDDRHYELHLKPYLKLFDESVYSVADIEASTGSTQRALNVLLYEDPLLGHSPPNKETTLRYLEIVNQLSNV